VTTSIAALPSNAVASSTSNAVASSTSNAPLSSWTPFYSTIEIVQPTLVAPVYAPQETSSISTAVVTASSRASSLDTATPLASTLSQPTTSALSPVVPPATRDRVFGMLSNQR
jgi:hypothetical protein